MAKKKNNKRTNNDLQNIRKDMDVNEHQMISNFTIRHTLK